MIKTVKKTKRVILDYSQNQDLNNKLSVLEKYYAGLSKAEIIKLAIVELFREKIDAGIVDLTDEEEVSLDKAMKSPRNIVLPKNAKFSDFIKSSV